MCVKKQQLNIQELLLIGINQRSNHQSITNQNINTVKTRPFHTKIKPNVFSHLQRKVCKSLLFCNAKEDVISEGVLPPPAEGVLHLVLRYNKELLFSQEVT